MINVDGSNPKSTFVFIINGTGGAGKDTFIKYCMKNSDTNDNKPWPKLLNIKNISSVDKVKEAAAVLGWEYGKDEKSRKFLSDLKKLSTEYNDYSFKYMIDRYKSLTDDFNKEYSTYRFIFYHIREPEEIDRFKTAMEELCPNVFTVLVDPGTRVELITTNESDKNIKEYKYDIIIMNDKSESCLNEISKDFINFFIERNTYNSIAEVGIITVTDNPNIKSYYRYETVDWLNDSIIFDAKIERLNYTIYKDDYSGDNPRLCQSLKKFEI